MPPPRRRKPRTRPRTDELDEIIERIRPVRELGPWVKALAYARHGHGKTTLGATGPNALILDINEEGTRSAADHPLAQRTKKFEARIWEDIGALYWLLRDKKLPFPVRCLSIDTVTGMHAMAFDFVLKDEDADYDPTREKLMPKDPRKTYDRANKLTAGMVTAFRNLPMHVIILAQERAFYDEETEEITMIGPDLPNGALKHVLGAVSITGRLERKKVRGAWSYRLRTAEDEVLLTKDRTRNLPPMLRDPTVPKLIRAWRQTSNSKETA